MVAEVVEHNNHEISALCRQYHVSKLRVFGSAATDGWDPGRSDLDFLFDLGGYFEDYASRFFGLRRAMEALTGYPVDLVSVGGFDGERDWFEKEVEATRVRVYDARDDQLVA